MQGITLWRGRRLGQHTLGFHKAGTPVTIIQAVYTYATAAGAGRVDELVVANVDAGMADTPAPTIVEEDDVAWLQLGARNQRRNLAGCIG